MEFILEKDNIEVVSDIIKIFFINICTFYLNFKIVNNNIQLSVIFETCENGIWTGHSDNFIEVRSRCGRDVHGEMLTVAPLSCSDGAVNGRIVFPDLEPRSGLSGSQQANT